MMLKKLSDDLRQLCRRDHPRLAEEYLSPTKNHQHGYAAYHVTLRYGRVFVHINLDHPYPVAEMILHLLEDGRHHPAGLTPLGREIHQDGFVTVDNIFEGTHVFFSSPQQLIYRNHQTDKNAGSFIS